MMGKKEQPAVGSAVNVTSYENKSIAVNGKVIGFGAVVELPEILQKSTAVKAFGREVFIDIPVQNHFATGEKVLIR
jgi:HlyD family secretion protein